MAGDNGCYLEASCVPSQSAMLRALGCPLGGMTKCPPQIGNTVTSISISKIYFSDLSLGMSDCPAMNVTDGTVQYSTEPSASGGFTGGTVATYCCANGYELLREENRTYLVDGTWTGAESQCTG